MTLESTTNVALPFLLVRLWRHLSKRRQRQFILLQGLILFSAFMEVVSLGAVLPFLGILVAPDLVFSQPAVVRIATTLSLTSTDQLVLALTIIFAVAALIAGAIRILLLWASTRLVFGTGSDLGIKVYRRTLFQPYGIHVSRNSSEVISGITSKVEGVMFGILMPLLTLASSAVLLLAITATLIVIDPMAASAAAVGFGASYAVITRLSRRRLQQNSQHIAHEQTQVLKALQEGLGGIRDVLLNGTQPVYCDIYRKADKTLRQAQGNNLFIGQSPRHIMEALGIVLISALAYALSREPGGVATALPMLGALALGAQRLLPALQQAYSAWANITGSYASMVDAIQLLDQPMLVEAPETASKHMNFAKDIRFEDVYFRYTTESPWVLDGLNLRILKGARVGLVGSTGSGKSTALDLLMGLLAPTQGRILVDGRLLSGNDLRDWQRNIAHVPQSIFLADATVAENIAFGVPANAIDLNRVKEAARQAQIAEFIEQGAEGYRAIVGEGGIRLSGGQRQRIGIARALYKQSSVLVFDEATSALDSATEQSVMNAIERLSRDLTIFLIAHRITTVSRCDVILELDQGRVVAQGKYQELMQWSPSFRRIAESLG